MAVKMLMLVFWVVSPEDGGSIFLRNIDINQQIHTILLPRRPTLKTKRIFNVLLSSSSYTCHYQQYEIELNR
jgi:hypothetical protein